tara:strand:- start:65 stop:700 length:636 start_codon:yes stop_codon:yes gene_type:complete
MRYKLLLILFALLPVLSFAQDEDLELWGSIKFSKKLTKKFRFELEEQIRWADSLSQYKKNFTDLGFKYKLHKRHSLELHLRLVDEVDEDKYMRYHVDANSDFTRSNFPLVFEQRLRFQKSWDEDGVLDKKFFRLKWGCALKNKAVSPYIAHEYYWRLMEENSLSKQRSTIGISWSMGNALKMKLFLRNQKDLNEENPDKLGIIGYGMHYKF